MIDEGYVKYQCHWLNEPTVTSAEIAELNQWRNKLYELNLIGQYAYFEFIFQLFLLSFSTH